MRATPLWIAFLLLPAAAWGDSSIPDLKGGDPSAAQRRCMAELRSADQRARVLWNASPPSEGVVVGGNWNYQRGGAMPPTKFTVGPLDYITAETIVTWREGGETAMTVSFLPDRVPGLDVASTGWSEVPPSPSYYDHLHLVRTPPSGSSQIWIRSSGRPIIFPEPLLRQLGVLYEAALDRCARAFPVKRRN